MRRWGALLAMLVALAGAGCAGSLPVETGSRPGCDRNGDYEQRKAC
jgi:hypothetical protein